MVFGSDSVSPIVLLKCARALSIPFPYLFNKSLRKGKFLTFWKTLLLTPIYKKGDKNDIPNYRPIAKLSPIHKILESSIQISLNNVCKYAVSNNQHGFIANKSTTTHLLELSAYITDFYIKMPS